MNRVLSSIATAWIIIIGIAYYRFHSFYLWTYTQPEGRAGVVIGGLVVLMVLAFLTYQYWYRNNHSWSWIHLTFWKVLGLVVLVTFVLANMLFFERGLGGNVSWLGFQGGLLLELGMLIGSILLILGVCSAVGYKVLSHLVEPPGSLMARFMYSVALGLLVAIIALFLLAATNTLNVFSSMGVLLLMLVIALPEATKFARDSWRTGISVKVPFFFHLRDC